MKEEVGEEEIAEVVAGWTGIPVSRLVESEREKLLRLPEILHKRVIGQDEAVDAVAEAVLRARAWLKAENRPIGFLYLPGTYRRRQNGACQSPVGSHVRFRTEYGAD